MEAVAENGPAAAAGLRPGDTILAVGEVRLAGEDRNRGTELIQGEAGTQVELLLRGSGGEERTVSVTRGRVEEHPVSYALLADGTGLITIQNFNSRCADEAIAAVDALREQGAERLVFDVRNNGGGFLDELTRLLDYLLPEGPIFRSQTKAGRETVVSSDAGCVEMPMAVLVNENTYSAAELFAAELQEWDWGEVVGVQTFGKGFSQQTFPSSTEARSISLPPSISPARATASSGWGSPRTGWWSWTRNRRRSCGPAFWTRRRTPAPGGHRSRLGVI